MTGTPLSSGIKAAKRVVCAPFPPSYCLSAAFSSADPIFASQSLQISSTYLPGKQKRFCNRFPRVRTRSLCLRPCMVLSSCLCSRYPCFILLLRVAEGHPILHLKDMSSYAYVSLSLIGLCALAGAGVGVGSGVAMMYQQMAQAEQEQKSTGAVAHSPGICLVHPYHT